MGTCTRLAQHLANAFGYSVDTAHELIADYRAATHHVDRAEIRVALRVRRQVQRAALQAVRDTGRRRYQIDRVLKQTNTDSVAIAAATCLWAEAVANRSFARIYSVRFCYRRGARP